MGKRIQKVVQRQGGKYQAARDRYERENARLDEQDRRARDPRYTFDPKTKTWVPKK